LKKNARRIKNNFCLKNHHSWRGLGVWRAAEKNHQSEKGCVFGQPFLYLYMFRFLAKVNKLILPSLTMRHTDMAKAKKWQLALIAWRYWVTVRALDER
jgi:hypothetical protein